MSPKHWWSWNAWRAQSQWSRRDSLSSSSSWWHNSCHPHNVQHFRDAPEGAECPLPWTSPRACCTYWVTSPSRWTSWRPACGHSCRTPPSRWKWIPLLIFSPQETWIWQLGYFCLIHVMVNMRWQPMVEAVLPVLHNLGAVHGLVQEVHPCLDSAQLECVLFMK